MSDSISSSSESSYSSDEQFLNSHSFSGPESRLDEDKSEESSAFSSELTNKDNEPPNNTNGPTPNKAVTTTTSGASGTSATEFPVTMVPNKLQTDDNKTETSSSQHREEEEEEEEEEERGEEEEEEDTKEEYSSDGSDSSHEKGSSTSEGSLCDPKHVILMEEKIEDGKRVISERYLIPSDRTASAKPMVSSPIASLTPHTGEGEQNNVDAKEETIKDQRKKTEEANRRNKDLEQQLEEKRKLEDECLAMLGKIDLPPDCAGNIKASIRQLLDTVKASGEETKELEALRRDLELKEGEAKKRESEIKRLTKKLDEKKEEMTDLKEMEVENGQLKKELDTVRDTLLKAQTLNKELADKQAKDAKRLAAGSASVEQKKYLDALDELETKTKRLSKVEDIKHVAKNVQLMAVEMSTCTKLVKELVSGMEKYDKKVEESEEQVKRQQRKIKHLERKLEESERKRKTQLEAKEEEIQRYKERFLSAREKVMEIMEEAALSQPSDS